MTTSRVWRRSTGVAALASALTLVGIGCGSSIFEPPDRPPTIDGLITRQLDNGVPAFPHLPAVLIEVNPAVTDPWGANPEADKIWTGLHSDTRVYAETANGRHFPVEITELRIGMRVKMWGVGIRFESFPGQMVGGTIIITELPANESESTVVP